MFVRAFGLFWQRDEVTWSPGAGRVGEFRLLGRHKEFNPVLQVADFRQQRGIYILHDDYGPYYVGLARDRPIGGRLRMHTLDKHRDSWDRFSWFGARTVLKQHDTDYVSRLGKVPATFIDKSKETIGDLEALLILTLGTAGRGNAQQMKFSNAKRWEQVRLDQVEHYLRRIANRR